MLGLDVLANKKREELSKEGAFKVPKDRVASIAASLNDEEEMSVHSGIVEVENNRPNDVHRFSNRRYRELATTETSDSGSVITEEIRGNKMHVHHGADNSPKVVAKSTGRSRYRSASSDAANYDSTRRKSREEYRTSYDASRNRHRYDREVRTDRESSQNHDDTCGEDYGRKRNRHHSSRKSPGRSDWDDGRWEWEDTPRSSGCRSNSKHYRPSPSPMLVGVSPDVRFVSPWLGGRTPNSTAPVSPWDTIAPSPTPIRASGSSVRSASSRSGGKYNQVAFSVNKLKSLEDGEDDLDDRSKL